MWLDKVLCLAFIGLVACASDIELQDVTATMFSDELDVWVRSEEETAAFRQMISLLAIPEDLQRVGWRSYSGVRATAICTVCKSVLKTMMAFRRAGMSEEHIKIKVVKLCTLLKIETHNVCEGSIGLNLPIILHIIDSKPNLTPSTICGVLLESKSCPLTDKEYQWTINIDPSPPKKISVTKTGKQLKIVQMTDLHYDPKYEPNGNAVCGEPNCCRKGQNATNTSGKLAGYWGDYNSCDTPWHAVLDVMDHINSTHKDIDYLYFTGDIIDHGVWETTKKGNIESLSKSYGQFYETFKVPIFPIFGNHEPHPLNQFAPQSVTEEELSTKWVYELLADIWIKSGGLPEHTRETILRGGYYTVSPKKGFRIITLNNNVCYAYNWWLFYDPLLPYGQLEWLHDTLLEAEKNEEFVHILAHIPPADHDCLMTWTKEYHKIVNRFSHIITGQFNGHTHNDELKIFYDDNLKVNNVAFNGGSVTTYKELNPNYKVYTADADTYEVYDYDNWMFNITEANLHPDRNPLWFISYSFKNEYNLEDLSYNSLGTFVLKLRDDEEMLDRYYGHFFKNAEPSLKIPCNKTCKYNYLCNIITSKEDHDMECAKILHV